MNTEFKPFKVQFQITRNLSDCRKPRYVAKKFGKVVADGRTLNEVRNSVSGRLGPLISPEFLVMVE